MLADDVEADDQQAAGGEDRRQRFGDFAVARAERLGYPAAARSKILQDGDKTLEVAYASLKGKGAIPPNHVSDADPVRIILNEELEQVWSDKKPAKAALDTAVARGNAVLAAKPALKKAQPF